MVYNFKEFSTSAIFNIHFDEFFDVFSQPKQVDYYTFIWAKSEPVEVTVDSIPLRIEPNHILALTPIQYLEYKGGSDVIIYQFNREFYCIKDHDQEVSCVGILFFGNSHLPIIHLNTVEQRKFELLHEVFLDELNTKDTIQAEMLRMLMARFIIKCTRLLKDQDQLGTAKSSKVDLLREFNFLVEQHFKKEHSVAFYAEQLFKSPKTLSNNFAKLNRSPLQIIHQRIILEAKRLLLYTDKSAKEIAYEIGFDDASHLSRLFKKYTSTSPSEFKKQLKPSA